MLSASFSSRGRQSNRPLNKYICNISNGNEDEAWTRIKRIRGSILNEFAGEGVSEKRVSEQRPEGRKGRNHQSGGRGEEGKGAPGGGNSQCKSLEEGASVVCLRSNEEAGMAGAECVRGEEEAS